MIYYIGVYHLPSKDYNADKLKLYVYLKIETLCLFKNVC